MSRMLRPARCLMAPIAALLAIGLLSPGAPTATPAAAAAVAAASAGPGSSTARAARRSTASMEKAVVRITNKKRAKKGCKPLKVNLALRKAARKHSRLMAEAGRKDPDDGLSHQLPGEPALKKRIVRAGYKKPTAWAENIAYNSDQRPSTVMKAWMNSPYGHRENILNCSVRHIGVGLVISNGLAWWTQDFGRK